MSEEKNASECSDDSSSSADDDDSDPDDSMCDSDSENEPVESWTQFIIVDERDCEDDINGVLFVDSREITPTVEAWIDLEDHHLLSEWLPRQMGPGTWFPAAAKDGETVSVIVKAAYVKQPLNKIYWVYV
jgi:hypothetical protein